MHIFTLHIIFNYITCYNSFNCACHSHHGVTTTNNDFQYALSNVTTHLC